MPQRFDVLIVGGGPGGCALASALAQLGLETLVLESSSYESVRIGESIPPDCRRIFEQLGLWSSFVEQGHERCYGSCSSWGHDRLGYNDFIVNPHGPGWHLDRNRFDRWLADRAVDAGADVRLGTRMDEMLAGDRRHPFALNWSDRSGNRGRVVGRFIVDATGRRAKVARRMGAQLHPHDKLVCHAVHIDGRYVREFDQLTLLEAVPYGWWYAARIPGDSVIAAVCTDSDIARAMQLRTPASWVEHLAKTRHLSERVDAAQLVAAGPSVNTWVAPSGLLSPPASTGWLAVGDAASTYDPISAQGIYKALSHADSAAQAIIDWLAHDTQAISQYREGVAEQFFEYLEQRRYFYALEERWPDSDFWSRRRSARYLRRGQPRVHYSS